LVVRESLDRLHRVRGDADHDRACFGVVRQVVADAARLDRAAAGGGLRIEVEDDRLAGIVAQADGIPVLGGERELGCGGACLDHAPQATSTAATAAGPSTPAPPSGTSGSTRSRSPRSAPPPA